MDCRIKGITALLLSALLAACSGGGGGGGGSKGGIDSPKQILKVRPFCQFDIKGQRGTEAQKIQHSEHLDKPYDVGCLEPIYAADVSVTIAYLTEVLKLRVFQVPFTGLGNSDCGPYAELPLPDEEGAQSWMAASGGQSGLSGLYSAGEQFHSPREILDPKILLKTCADRWTVLHETMHHLFNMGRKEDPEYMSVSELNERVNAAVEKYTSTQESYKEFEDGGSLLVHARSLGELLTYYFEVSRRSSLEEVSIEATLIDLANKGQLKNISPAAPSNALQYMYRNLTQFMSVAKGLATNVDQIEKIAQERRYPAVTKEIQTHKESLNSFMQGLEDLWTQSQIKSQGPAVSGPQAHFQFDDAQPSFHQHGDPEIAETLERISDVLIEAQLGRD